LYKYYKKALAKEGKTGAYSAPGTGYKTRPKQANQTGIRSQYQKPETASVGVEELQISSVLLGAA
jgi:hypothetical protein